MSTTLREDDSSRALIPYKLGKQPVGIGAAPNTPCSRKVGAVEADVISPDDDFEKIAYPKNGKSSVGTIFLTEHYGAKAPQPFIEIGPRLYMRRKTN